MDIKAYIASGILELYVAGALSAEENLEVQQYALRYPEIQKEIESIEAAILQLTATTSPGMQKSSFDNIGKTIKQGLPFRFENTKMKSSWSTYLGWAASILFAVGMLWMYSENNKLKTEVEITQQERQALEKQILEARETIADKEKVVKVLNQLRNKDVDVIALGGQAVAPESYAKVYWNKTNQNVYIDAKGLPVPPPGFTYQVWSLKLDPLTPTSLGLLDDLTNSKTAIYELENTNASEAFGITLEPIGGSKTPNLEQLYTLGAVGP